jgi:hypothetical protein
MISLLVCWCTPTLVRMHVLRLSILLTRTHVSLDFVVTPPRLASLPCVVLSMWVDRVSYVIVPMIHRQTPKASSGICCLRVSLELALRCGYGLSLLKHIATVVLVLRWSTLIRHLLIRGFHIRGLLSYGTTFSPPTNATSRRVCAATSAGHPTWCGCALRVYGHSQLRQTT